MPIIIGLLILDLALRCMPMVFLQHSLDERQTVVEYENISKLPPLSVDPGLPVFDSVQLSQPLQPPGL